MCATTLTATNASATASPSPHNTLRASSAPPPLSASAPKFPSAGCFSHRRGVSAFVDSPRPPAPLSTSISPPFLPTSGRTTKSFSSSSATPAATPGLPLSEMVLPTLPRNTTFVLAAPACSLPLLLDQLAEEVGVGVGRQGRVDTGGRDEEASRQGLAFNVKDKMSLFISVCSLLVSVQLLVPRPL